MTRKEHENQARSLKLEGQAVFERARFSAFWEEMQELLLQRPVGLLSFDEVKHRLHLSEQHYVGLENIPLAAVVGSVGRYRDFTRDFMPKKNQMLDRWSSVYIGMNDLTGVPPIDVYKVDDVYFVKDGNHRVSIARRLGYETIEAYVTELASPIHLRSDMTHRDLDAAAAHVQFLQETGLRDARPDHLDMTLNNPGRYNDMIGHIRLVQRVLVHQQGQPVAFKAAALRWYERIYTPMIDLICKYSLLDEFPHRTQADMYVWIIEYFERLVQTYGESASEATLSNALVDFLADHKIPIPKRLLTETDEPLGEV
jgi:hypothetical protein